MTYTPDNLMEVRRIYQRYTGLPAVSLGIQHYPNKNGTYTGGGGYHAGNDLLAKAGRLTTDYSKRESALDRPGSNAASAIDIGYFDVTLPNGRRVTLHDRSAWVLAHWSEAPWIRELIYSPDRKVVKRKDRLGIRTSGDRSHLGHDHESYHRDFENDPRIPAFHQRFWDEMSGIPTDRIGEGMFNVIRVRESDGTDAWYGAIVGRPLVGIANGAQLQDWRAMKDASGGREFEVPEHLLEFARTMIGGE